MSSSVARLWFELAGMATSSTRSAQNDHVQAKVMLCVEECWEATEACFCGVP